MFGLTGERMGRHASRGMIEAEELIAQEAVGSGVLHMGCGDGSMIIEELYDLSMYAIGVDDNAKKIGAAMKASAGKGRCEFRCRPLELTGLSGSNFDFVFGYDLARRGVFAIDEARRVLRHGGVFITVERNERRGDQKNIGTVFPNVEAKRFGILSRVTIFRAVKS